MPWDCSNWAAYAHEDRTTAILETLAENRGRTLYCGIDQSDTFTKAETWAAGRDRNERDDTVYFGENGNFRGFIAAQEGWLTEGESGITGQSTATIFEFPREERGRRRWKTIRLKVPADSSRRIYSAHSRNNFAQNHIDSAKTQALTRFRDNRPTGWAADVADASWLAAVEPRAAAHCKLEGYQRATRVTPTLADSAYGYGNFNSPNWDFFDQSGTTQIFISARKINTWSAVCVKRVRGPRR